MNLRPLYDVKERLEQAAIAGVGLLAEDFRLSRAAEQLKPLAGASPVFGKIDAGLTQLLSAPAGERSGLLLDVLALVATTSAGRATFCASWTPPPATAISPTTTPPSPGRWGRWPPTLERASCGTCP